MTITTAEWMRRIGDLRDPNAVRLALAVAAFAGRCERDAWVPAVAKVLGITEAEVHAAVAEMERAGLAVREWLQ